MDLTPVLKSNITEERIMKCTVKKETLLPHLQKVVGIISKKATMPILCNLKIEAAGQELTLSGNCLDMEVQTVMPAEVGEEGITTLPAYRLLESVNKLDGNEIELKSDDRFHGTITSGNASLKLLGLNPQDYPQFPDAEPEQRLNLKTADCIRMIDQVAYAVNINETRKVLQGILFEFQDHCLTAVATDGKRLARSRTEMEDCEAGDFRIIVPHKAALEIKKISEGSDGIIEFEFNSKFMHVRIGTTTLRTKLIEGNYPNYQLVIPKDFSKSLELTSSALAQALDLVGVPIGGGDNVTLKFTTGQLKLHTESAAIGEGTVTLAAPHDFEEEMKFVFNQGMLRDPFRFSGMDTLTFRMNDATSPIALENGSFLYIQMPMRNK